MKPFISILFYFITCSVMGQANGEIIRGRLTSISDEAPIPYAVVMLVETEQWTTTNKDGEFTFEVVNIEQFTLEVHHLGKQKYCKSFLRKACLSEDLEIKLLSESYTMKEVVVTAEKGRGMSTTSTINSTALQYVQPTTLGDAMQLLPGALINNPDLSKIQTISIREIGIDDNSAAGTAIIIDEAPISNDANFQTYSTVDMSAALEGSSTAGSGIDIRQISTDNIESIEIIKGIPSVEYGNLTSGVVLIKTKSGYTPLEVKIKSDPNIKHGYIGKGIRLKQGGATNFNIDYTRSFNDLRTKYTGYDRLTAQVAYSKLFFKDRSPLSFNSKISVFNTLSQEKTDPDALVPDEVINSSEIGGRFNIYGKWSLNNSFFSNLSYTFSTSVSAQEEYEKKYRSIGLQKISLSLEKGENQGIYLPNERLTELYVKGLPVNIYAQIKGDKNVSFSSGFINNTKIGADYRLSGNYGEGRIYDISNPPVVDRTSSRPRSFKDIPAAHSYSLFLENKITVPIGTTTLDMQAGIRVNNFQPTGLIAGDVGIYAEPRLNARYKIVDDKRSFVKLLSLHGGIGLNYKSAPLFYLYPDLTYVDLVSLEHYTGDPNTSLVYFTTHVYNSSNPNLKASKSFKREFGFDFTMRNIKGSFTGYFETLSDGFGVTSKYAYSEYLSYNDDGLSDGVKPNINTLPSEIAKYIVGFDTPTNNKESQKYGVEYDFNFGKITPISTSVTMNGAWMRTQRIKSTENYNYNPNNSEGGKQHPYIGVYPAGEGIEYERLNTNFTFITHSAPLRLIFTTTMQVVWYDKIQQMPYDEVPIYLYGEDGKTYPFTESMRNDPHYRDYVMDKGVHYFNAEIMPPLLLCNFKLSKELSDFVKLSFYANNFLNHRPTYQYEQALSFIRRNPSIYFGAELKIEI